MRFRDDCLLPWLLQRNTQYRNSALKYENQHDGCHSYGVLSCDVLVSHHLNASWELLLPVLNVSKLKCLHISVVFLGLFASKVNPGVIIGINRLAKMDGVLQLLAEHRLTRVSRHLQKEETGVRFRQVVVWGRVFVKHLKKKKKKKKKKTTQNSEFTKPTHFALLHTEKAHWQQVAWKAKILTAILAIICTSDLDNICKVVEKMFKCCC